MHLRLSSGFCLSIICGLSPLWVRASDSVSIESTLEDAKLYFTAPIRWNEQDWLYFGGALLAIGAAHDFDRNVRDHFATGSQATLNGGEDKNSLRDAIPTLALVAGTGVGAWFYRDADGYQETWALVEAGVFSTVTAEALSLAAGRERPDGTTSPNKWREGDDSFPSLHSTAAWAVGTVFAESGSDEYRWVRRFIGYGVALGTSYVRVSENVHWLSDTVAGAAIGIATARFILNREGYDGRVSMQIQPVKNGWELSYTVRFE
jgi:hypothetical protein